MFETQGSEARLPENRLSAAPVSPGCRGVWHTTKGTQFPSAGAAKLEGVWSAVDSPFTAVPDAPTPQSKRSHKQQTPPSTYYWPPPSLSTPVSLIATMTLRVSNEYCPILRMGKSRHRAVEYLVLDHTAKWWQSQQSTPAACLELSAISHPPYSVRWVSSLI